MHAASSARGTKSVLHLPAEILPRRVRKKWAPDDVADPLGTTRNPSQLSRYGLNPPFPSRELTQSQRPYAQVCRWTVLLRIDGTAYRSCD